MIIKAQRFQISIHISLYVELPLPKEKHKYIHQKLPSETLEVQDKKFVATLFLKFSTGEKHICNEQPPLQETLQQIDFDRIVIRIDKEGKIVKTIEESKSIKFMRLQLANARKEIVKLKDKKDDKTLNREHLLQIMESFSETSTNQSTIDPKVYLHRTAQNRGYGNISEISLDEI